MKILYTALVLTAVMTTSCKTTQPSGEPVTGQSELPQGEPALGGREDMDQEAPAQSSPRVLTASGLEVEILETGFGRKASAGDLVTVHYSGTLENGFEFDNSFKRGEPITFVLGKGKVIKGWEEGIAMLNVGTKGRFRIPPDLGYGERETGTIPANSTLIFEVLLLDAVELLAPKPFDTAAASKIVTASGLNYYIVKAGQGPNAVAGNMVSVHYTGYLLDGKKFDSSLERGMPFRFELGKGSVIKGWEEGFTLLNAGAKARLIIPPGLAYGEGGFPPIIPANATLIFDVELLEIK